ncbi:hypothetical protein VTO73DRAFT_12222 [Trametes versicolor]
MLLNASWYASQKRECCLSLAPLTNGAASVEHAEYSGQLLFVGGNPYLHPAQQRARLVFAHTNDPDTAADEPQGWGGVADGDADAPARTRTRGVYKESGRGDVVGRRLPFLLAASPSCPPVSVPGGGHCAPCWSHAAPSSQEPSWAWRFVVECPDVVGVASRNGRCRACWNASSSSRLRLGVHWR